MQWKWSTDGKWVIGGLTNWSGIRNSDNALGDIVVRKCGNLRRYSPSLKCTNESAINAKLYCVVLSEVAFLTTSTMLAVTPRWHLRVLLKVDRAYNFATSSYRSLRWEVRNLSRCCGCKTHRGRWHLLCLAYFLWILVFLFPSVHTFIYFFL